MTTNKNKLHLFFALLFCLEAVTLPTVVDGRTFAPNDDDDTLLAHWILDSDHYDGSFFPNGIENGPPVMWSTNTPAFQTKDGREGVVCSYNTGLHGTTQSTELTVPDPNMPIVTYGIRFLLNNDPSVGGGGRYSHHGFALFGYYIGPKVNIEPDGQINVVIQHDPIHYFAGWVGRYFSNNVEWEVDKWYEMIVTVDNTLQRDNTVIVCLDGVELELDASSEVGNGSVRLPGENDWDTFGVGTDHFDRNTLDGLIGELFVQRGYYSIPTSQGSFSLQNEKFPTGCIMVKGSGRDDSKLMLGSCKMDMPSQIWTYENGLFRTTLSGKCLQAGRGGNPEDGKKMRIYSCDSSNELQRFDWTVDENGGGDAISLASFPDYCVVSRGIRAHLDEDPIILKECDLIEPERLQWNKAAAAATHAPDDDMLAYWIFDSDHENHGFFPNKIRGGPTVMWSTNTPAFQTKDGREGVVCSYDDQLYGTTHSTELTVSDLTEPIVTYGVRFLLNNDPSVGGGGRYSQHGFCLFGYYIGPKVTITPDGTIHVVMQHDPIDYFSGWVGRYFSGVEWDVDKWYEMIVTVDNTLQTDNTVIVYLDGDELELDASSEVGNGSVRLPRENDWDTFGVGWEHYDENTLDGLIGELFVLRGYFVPSDQDADDWTFDSNGGTTLLAYWIFDNENGSDGSFPNQIEGAPPVKWNADTPSFETKDGIEGVVCNYDDQLYGTLQSTEYTVSDPNEPIVTYGIRFLLNNYPSVGGGGSYNHHGFRLFGYYIGPKIDIEIDGRIDVEMQHDPIDYYSGWIHRYISGVEWEVDKWYELILTVDNTTPTNTIVIVYLDGEPLELDPYGPGNGGVRLPGENDWDTFGVGTGHFDRNTLDGLIAELFVLRGYFVPSDQDTFSLRNEKFPNGCIMVEGSGQDDSKLMLGSCETDTASQIWTFENGLFRTTLSGKCLQAGRGGNPEDGKKMRIYPCDVSNELQRFDWTVNEDGGGDVISLTSFPDYCVVSQGVRAHLDEDPIILKECDLIEPQRLQWNKAPLT